MHLDDLDRLSEGGKITVTAGYGSAHDGIEIKFNICDHCIDKIVIEEN